jgi:hypothetical protein
MALGDVTEGTEGGDLAAGDKRRRRASPQDHAKVDQAEQRPKIRVDG